MVIASPVAGLRPSRASRRPTDSAKKPGTLSFSPLAAASSSVLCRLRRTASTVFCSRSAWSATAATSSLRVTHISLDRWDVPASSMVDRPCFLEFWVPTRRLMSELSDFRLTLVTLSRLSRATVRPAARVYDRAAVGGVRRASWGCGAAGSAPHWQCGGQGFESPQLHPFHQGFLQLAHFQVDFWLQLWLQFVDPYLCRSTGSRPSDRPPRGRGPA